MKRRNFLKNTAAVASLPFIPTINISKTKDVEELLKNHLPVNFTRDGLDLSPTLTAQILQILSKNNDFNPDSYGNGGMIHQFEEKVARALGKEKAIYMPSGTLANHIALRQHCTTKKRAIVQYNSHINRDSGDCATTLSRINLITLGAKQVVFNSNELEGVLDDNNKGKVQTPIGVLSLESPVRRNHLQRIPFKEIEKLTKIAKNNGIATHFDAARLFIDAAFSGHAIKEYTVLFDTVYLSLYKSFNSVNGAILVGSADIIDGLTHERRMFGAGLPSSWQQVAIANYFFDNYQERYQNALKQFQKFKSLLEQTGKYKIESLTNGSNVFKLKLKDNSKYKKLSGNLAKQNISFPKWNAKDNCFYLKMNDSLVYYDMEEIVSYF
jgi:threonine aldolase